MFGLAGEQPYIGARSHVCRAGQRVAIETTNLPIMIMEPLRAWNRYDAWNRGDRGMVPGG